MKIRTLTTRAGASLPISEIGFGTAPLGDLYERLDEQAALATLQAAYRAGITLFDTSPHYGNGLAEARCGAVLRQMPRDSFLLSTKVGRWMDPFGKGSSTTSGVASPGFAGGFPHRSVFDYSYDGTMRSIEQSLLRLGFERIDILLIHDADVWTHGAEGAEERFRESMNGAYRALDRLRREGTVVAIGVGLNESEMCEKFARAGDFDVMLLAGRYSLLEQPAIESFLPLAESKGIGVLLGGVFNSGILATGAVPGARYNYRPAPPDVLDRVRKLEEVCGRHGVPLSRAALRFALSHPSVISLVLGGVRPQEVTSNVRDAEQDVPGELWSDLKRERLLGTDVPTPN